MTSRWIHAGAALALALAASGCKLLQFREQWKVVEREACNIRGTIRAEQPRGGQLVVVLGQMDVAEPSIEGGEGAIVDHYVLRGEEGRWFFRTPPGSYAVTAFQDLNADGIYYDEPVIPRQSMPRFELSGGEDLTFDLVIPLAGRLGSGARYDIAELRARSASEQEAVTAGRLARKGELVQIDDARFSEENGDLGLWRPVDFTFDVGAGIYFLEKCDPRRVPVLFVHGIGGHPREFEALIERLDRERLQPWLLFYPSGTRLDTVSAIAAQTLMQLGEQCGVKRIFVVAHSMGGLVARSLVFDYASLRPRAPVALFVSISSPWGGIDAAALIPRALGPVQHMMPFSFEYVAADSSFVTGLFYEDPETRQVRRRFPPDLSWTLMFGHTRDGVVPNRSSARWEAVEEAHKVWPLDYDHTSILRSDEASAILNAALRAALR